MCVTSSKDYLFLTGFLSYYNNFNINARSIGCSQVLDLFSMLKRTVYLPTIWGGGGRRSVLTKLTKSDCYSHIGDKYFHILKKVYGRIRFIK